MLPRENNQGLPGESERTKTPRASLAGTPRLDVGAPLTMPHTPFLLLPPMAWTAALATKEAGIRTRPAQLLIDR